MARTPKRFSAGTIMLQVVPTIRGMEDAIDPAAKRIGDKIRDETKRGADEAANEQVKSHKKAADEIAKVDEASAENRKRWAAEDTARRAKAAREYVGLWNKALDDRDAAEKKSADAQRKQADDYVNFWTKALNDRDVAEKKSANTRAKQRADAEIAANQQIAKSDADLSKQRQRWAAEETQRNRKQADDYVDFWTDALNDREEAEQKASDARIAATKREEEAQKQAHEREEKARERAREKQERFDKAFLHSQSLAAVRAQQSVLNLGDRDQSKLARSLQKALSKQKFDIEVRPDGNVFEREMADLMARLKYLQDVEIGVDMDAKQFNVEMAHVRARLQGLTSQKHDVQIAADASDALRSIAAVNIGLRATRAEARKTNRELDGLGSGAGSAANSFRAMNGYLLAAVALGPILIPILASIGGLLVGIAAGAIGVGLAIGTMVFGLMGIGTAISAMSKADQEARQRAAQAGFAASRPTRTVANMRTERSRALALRDARERVADARADAPAAIDNALRRQESAERSLIDAQKSALRAQQDLNEARQQASRDLEDMNLQLRGAALDEQQAAYDMQRAGIRYNAVLEDDQATAREKDEARIAYEQAILANDELLLRNERLREEAAEAAKAGVEGSDAVVSAKERIADADQGVLDAQEAVAEAERSVAETRIDQAERIADAERNLTELIEDQRLERLAAAEAAAIAAAGTDTFNNATFELTEAMNELSPAGQRFATWLYELKPLLDLLKFTVQETFLPGLQAALTTIIDTYGPGFIEFMGEMGTALGDGAVKIADWLTGPEMQGFFATLAEYGPTWFTQFLDIVMGFSEGAFLIFEQLAPFATILGDAIVGLAESFAAWADSEEGQKAISDFVGYLIESGPDIWNLFASAMAAIVNLMIALAPYADSLVEIFTAVFDWIAGMDPDDLAMIAGAVIALVAAFQLFFIVMAFVGTIGLAMAALGGGVGVLIAGIAIALVALVVWIAVNWPKIKAWFLQLYEEYIKPVVDKIAEAWNWLYDSVLYPVWEGIKTGLDLIGSALTIVYNVWVIWLGFLGGLWDTFYEETLSPVLDTIKDALVAVGNWIEEHVAPVWETAIGVLGALWRALSEAAKTPIRFILETVINKGIIDNFNDFADNFPGTIKVPHVSVPSWLQPAEYATGTSNMVLPGYTPGRDVHRFVSPTGGVLDLSGGEGILRPEVVRALGPAWIDRVNAAARGQGSVGVLRHLGAYADGGVLGAIGNVVGGAAAALSSVVGTVMEFVTDPREALETAIKGLLGDWQTDNAFGSLILSVPRAIIDAAADYVQSIFTPDVIAKAQMGVIGKDTNLSMKGWANPSVGPITSRWGPRTMFGNSFHAGTDIAGGGPVYAASAGKILHAGLVNPFVAPGRSGSVMQILHNDGTVTWYGHMLPKDMLVKKGDSVASGQRIGLQGALGRVTGVHLHYETHTSQDKGVGVNPEPFMHQRGVALGRAVSAGSGGGGGPRPLLYDDGGYLQPGYTMVLNATGKPEPVLTSEQLAAIQGGGGRSMGPAPFDGATFQGYSAEEIMQAYEEHRRREAVMAGEAATGVMIP